jgi:high frequency lysogenization protein
MSRTTDRALALAGVFGAAALVDEVAKRADPEPERTALALAPLFRFDAPDVAAVYGGAANLGAGLAALDRVLGEPTDEDDGLVLRYALGLLHFERVYSRDRELQDALRRALRRAQLAADAEGLAGESSVATLADAWTRTLGEVRPRIMVSGDPQRLQRKHTVDLVRALLLAGLRSAVLWRQVGGSRWTLLFGRAALRREARRLLAA